MKCRFKGQIKPINLLIAALMIQAGVAHAADLVVGSGEHQDVSGVLGAAKVENGGQLTAHDAQFEQQVWVTGTDSVFSVTDSVLQGEDSHLLKVEEGAQVQLNATDLSLMANVATEEDGSNATAIAILSGGSVKMNGGVITSNVDGINANAATFDLNGMQMHLSGEGAYGVWSLNGASGSMRDSQVISAGNFAVGVSVTGPVSSVFLDNSSINMAGESAHALQLANGGDITVQGGTINVSGSNGMVLSASAGNLSAQGNLTLTDARVHSADGAVLNNRGSRLDVELNNTSASSGRGVLLNAIAGSSTHGALTRLGLTNSQVAGDINSDALSTTDVSLAGGSVLTGAIRNGNDVSVDDSSQWLLSDSSSVNSLSNFGTLAFAPTTGFKQLLVQGDLSGDGRFLMNTDLASGLGDLLVIQGQTLGNSTLLVADTGYEPAAAEGRLMLVDGNGGPGGFTLLGGSVDAGAFRYVLAQDGDDWVLINKASAPEPETPEVPEVPEVPEIPEIPEVLEVVDPDPEPSVPVVVAPQPAALSKGANAAVAQQTARAALWSAETASLGQHMSDLRLSKGAGVWVKSTQQHQQFDPSTSRAFEQTLKGVQVGADKAISYDGGTLYVGGLIGIGESRQQFGEGTKGTVDSRTLGVYGAWLDASGLYVGAQFKYSRFDNRVEVLDNLGGKSTGRFNNDAYGASVEVGKRFELDHGWFVEPQIQVSAGRIKGGNYTQDNGLQVQAGAVDTLQSRVGAMVGTQVSLGAGVTLQPYVKAGWVSEHAGDARVRVNGHKLKAALPGDRAEVGIGGVLNLGDKHQVSLQADYADGQGIKQPWAVTVGYRFEM
ncbi:autotransporter outer membrane beta-barrel domain-containing protein [Pseudomonas fontis]|uniref:autotransporter outer membrane beta-barrel domain-containing protein n=1 Tax=Pseudomonas fontis TaxID=2942633 RepID=UPI0023602573|nr:autotransporter outer membrane beta-barrel domain-containing protein [Pseudomonas fontis]MDD0977143.1 autotransporter outer membrane beta-barrel domain-containing protein [Pseudomonas fontis]